MVAHTSGAFATLRDALKARTRPLHDALDAAIGGAVLDSGGHAAFLTVQLAARAPIERWAAAHMPCALKPPPMAALIVADLAELGAPRPEDECFAVPPDVDHLGVAWALGGSALGNKAILVQRRRAGCTTANRFLGDGATAQYFRRILPLLGDITGPRDTDAAVGAAEAVFRTFLAAASRVRIKAAA